MKKNPLKAVLILALGFLASCQSLQKDLLVSGQREDMESGLLELERAIIPLDGPLESADRQAGIAAARKMIVSMEKEAAADMDLAGKLAAWSGRLSLLEGKTAEARRLYQQSLTFSPGNIPALILGIRLEGDAGKRLETIDQELLLAGYQTASFSSGAAELQIERGRALLELRRFGEAAGAFDTAFTSGLDSVYAAAYRPDRDRAWELRNAETSGGAAAILERGSLNWKDCISLAKTETQLLRFLTAGRDIAEAELFDRLVSRSFIPSTQDTGLAVTEWPQAKPRIDAQVLRAGAAWFLWRLYAEGRADRSLLSRYSARYNPGSRSPIADIPPVSPFFDSILGCVETELLSLPDGRNFRPGDSIRAAEFLAILKKLDG